MFAACDTTVKMIGATVPLLILLCLRYICQAVVLGLWQAHHDVWTLFRTKSIKLQMMRSALLLTNTACTFSGLRYLPLPVATSLAMLAPLISTLLASLILKDEVPLKKWAVVVLGFSGMLLVVQPASVQFTWSILYPIAAATSFACYQVVSSHLARVDAVSTTNFLTALGAVVVLCAVLCIERVDMLIAVAHVRPLRWLLAAAMALLATGGHLLLLQAMRRVPLSLLSPFSYMQLGFAALLSWLFFGEIRNLTAVAGMCLIAISGMVTAFLNSRGPL